jgi:hypothetical protein
VLAFSDQALARLMRAAKGVHYSRRATWLRKVARHLDPSPNAIRLRNARLRQGYGVGFYRLMLNEVAVEEMLTREGLLLPGRDYSRIEVEVALAEFINRLCSFDMGSN